MLTYAISEQKWLLNLTAFLVALFLKIYIGIWASTIGLYWNSNQLWNHVPRFLVNQRITFPTEILGLLLLQVLLRFCISFCLQCKRLRIDPWARKILWRRKWQPTPVCLLRNPIDRGAWPTTVHEVAVGWDWTTSLSIWVNPQCFKLIALELLLDG